MNSPSPPGGTPPDDVLEDARGLLCPIPVIRLGERIRRVSKGVVVRLLADDPAAAEDVRLWAASQGHELLEVLQEGREVQIRVRRVGRSA